MKNVFFSLLLVVASVVGVRAQSNTLLVYGNVGFSSQKAGSSTTNNYSFSPGVGYQWNDHWTGGINLNVGGNSVTSINAGISTTAKSSNLYAGPFVRYTQPLGGIFAIYGQFNANYLSGKTTSDSYIQRYSGFQGTLFPAIGMNLKNGFALNFSFGSLSFLSEKFDNIGTSTSFGLSFGSGASFGISKNFGLKKK